MFCSGNCRYILPTRAKGAVDGSATAAFATVVHAMAAAVPYGYANPPRPVGGYGNYGNPQQNPALLAAMINAQNGFVPPPPPGVFMMQPQQQPVRKPPGNPLIKKKEPAVATKITGDPKNLVLPAKRRQEIASKYMQRLEEEARLRKEEEGEDDSPAAQAAKRSPEEQLEHEATVAAMRKEIASIALHREVLDKREQKLYKRLAEMGEEMEDPLS